MFWIPFLQQRSPLSSTASTLLSLWVIPIDINLVNTHFGHLMWRAGSLVKTRCWEILKAKGQGDNRGWDGWMASPTQGTWVWAISGRWWRTGKPGVLQSMGPQRVRYNLVTEQQQWSILKHNKINFLDSWPCTSYQSISKWYFTAEILKNSWSSLSSPIQLFLYLLQGDT